MIDLQCECIFTLTNAYLIKSIFFKLTKVLNSPIFIL